MTKLFDEPALKRFKKDLASYDLWTNARRFAFQDIIVFGIGLLVSLCADPIWNSFNALLGGEPNHPMFLGLGQILSVLVFTFLLIQNIIRWRES